LKKLSFLLIVFSFIGLKGSFPQTSSIIDSMQQTLSGSKTLTDSISALCWLCWQISDSDPQSTYKYGKKLLDLSKRISDETTLAEIYDASALAFRVKGDLQMVSFQHLRIINLCIPHLSAQAGMKAIRISL